MATIFAEDNTILDSNYTTTALAQPTIMLQHSKYRSRACVPFGQVLA
jgi:hypothetical protein